MVCEVLAVAPQQQGPACTSKLDPHLGEEEQQASDTSASEGTTYLLLQCPAPAALAGQQQQQQHQQQQHRQTPLGTSTLAAAPGASCCTSSGQQHQVSSRAGSVQSVNTAALDAAVLAAARHNGPQQQQQQQQQPQVVRQVPGSLWRGQHSSSTTRDAHPPAHSRSCDDHAPKQQQAGGQQQQQQHGTGCIQLSVHQQQQQQQVQVPCRSRSDQGKLLTLLNRYSGLTKQHLSGCIIPHHSVVLPPRPPRQQQQQHVKPLQQPSPAATAAGRCLACSPSKPGWCARCRQQQAVHTQQQQQQRPPAAGCPQHTPQRHWQAQPPHLHRQQQQQQPQDLSQQQQQQSEEQVHAWRWRQDHSGRYGDILPRLDELRPLLQMHAAAAAADTLQQVLSTRRELGPVPAAAAAAGGSGGGGVTVCQQQAVAAPQQQQQQLTSSRQRQGQAPPPLQPLPTHQQQPRQGQVADASSAPVPAAAAAATVVAAVPSALLCPGADAAPGGGGRCASSCPKRPWQPRMAPDEPNWNQAAFVDIQSRYGASYAQPPAGKAGSKGWPRTLPEHSTATFAQLMLLHGAGWPNHLMWERWQQAHPAGSLTMFVHMKQGVVLSPGMPGRDLIVRTKLKVSLDSRWGDISLVEATLLGLEEVLRRCPHVAHIGLSSGHDVPVQLIRPGLLLPGVSLFGLYQFGAPEMDTLQSAVLEELLEVSALTPTEAAAWRDALTFHHQWMVLSREHAAALVHHRREILMIGRLLHKACCSVRAGMAPDEFIIITALKQLRLVRSVQRVEVKPHMRYPPGTLLNSYPTFVVFPAVSSPHPVLWTHLDKKVRCQVEKNTGQQYHTLLSLNDCLDLAVERCGIYFRKIEVRPTATDQLVMLLSSLEAMWAGQRKGSTAALKTSSGSTTTANKGGGSNSRRGGGGGSSSNKRRHNSPNPSAGTGSTLQTSQDAAADATSPTYSAACDTTAAAAVVVGVPDAAAGGGVGGGVSLSSGGCGAPDNKRRRSSVEAGS